MTSNQAEGKRVMVQVNGRCQTCIRPLWKWDEAVSHRGYLYHPGECFERRFR
jgi:hypothetical protein